MNRVRKAFTMIELIFVIVILSIVAAAIVPKIAEEKAKGTVFEKVVAVGAEIREEINEQSAKSKQRTFSEAQMEEVIVQKEQYKQKMLKAVHLLEVEKNKLFECQANVPIKSVEFSDSYNSGTGY